ncbi:MAG: glycosyl hydrolase family 28-related protein, partial [Chloroflexota bacterium]
MKKQELFAHFIFYIHILTSRSLLILGLLFTGLIGLLPVSAVNANDAAIMLNTNVSMVFNVDSTADLPDTDLNDNQCQASNGNCTLRAAIEQANAQAGNVTVNVPAGTYFLDSQIVIQDDVEIYGAGRNVTIIDGQNDTKMFRVESVDLLVCDNGDHSIVSYTRYGEPIGSFILPKSNGLEYPSAIDQNSSGDIFVTTFFEGVIQYDTHGEYIRPFAHPATLGDTPLLTDGVFSPDSPFDFYVADFYPSNRVLQLAKANGNITKNTLTHASMEQPNSIAFHDEDVFVTDTGADAVLRFDGETGDYKYTFISSGLERPRGLLFKDNLLYVADEGSNSVKKYSALTGTPLGAFVTSGSGGLDKPSDIGFGPDGHFYVLSNETDQILRYDGQSGEFLGVFLEKDGTHLEHPSCFEWRTDRSLRGPSVTMEDLTIQNGRTKSNGDETAGLVIKRGASVTLQNVVLDNHESRILGGAIQNWGWLTMWQSDVLDSSLPEGGGGMTSQGGGIFNAGRLIMIESLVANNFATRGGGISNVNDGDVYILNSTITGNQSFGSGGGIRNVNRGRVQINHSTIVRNEINVHGSWEEPNRFGGGLYTSSTAETIVGNSIVAENSDNRNPWNDDYGPDC